MTSDSEKYVFIYFGDEFLDHESRRKKRNPTLGVVLRTDTHRLLGAKELSAPGGK